MRRSKYGSACCKIIPTPARVCSSRDFFSPKASAMPRANKSRRSSSVTRTRQRLIGDAIACGCVGRRGCGESFDYSAQFSSRACAIEVHSYTPAMLDIRLIRENADLVRERLATRNAGDEAKISEVLALDEALRKILSEVEQLKATRNRVSKEIGALMGQKKLAEAEAKKAETKSIGDRITELDKKVAEVEMARDAILIRLPNLPHASVAIGKTAEENPEIRKWGSK